MKSPFAGRFDQRAGRRQSAVGTFVEAAAPLVDLSRAAN